MQQKTQSVSSIREGTVIDHIPVGQAIRLMRLLKLNKHRNLISIGLHLPSPTRGFKDLIKIEHLFLSEKEASEVAVFAPTATLSIIRNYQVQKKLKANLPKVIEGLLVCPNHHCITRDEPLSTVFFVEEHKNNINLRCKYCEKCFPRDSFNYD